MKANEAATMVELWRRAYPKYLNDYVPSREHIQDWFHRHEDKDFTFWAEWPEGVSLRVYLSRFYATKKRPATVYKFPKRGKK